MPEVKDIEDVQLNVLEIVIRYHVDKYIEDDTLCRPEDDPTVVERPDVRHVPNNFIDDNDEQLSPQSGSSDDE